MNRLLTLWRNPKARHLTPSLIALAILILIAVLAPVIAPHDPLALGIPEDDEPSLPVCL